MSKPLVLLVSDVPGWAFDQNMRDLAEYLSGEFDFEHFYTEDWLLRGKRLRWDRYDVIYEAYHRNPPMGMPRSKMLGALRCEWFTPENLKPPGDVEVALVNRYRAYQVACKRNLDELRDRCPNVVYLTNPVNMMRFEHPPLAGRIVAEWNGNSGHKSADGRVIKHFHDIVVPACQAAGIPLIAAEYGVKEGPNRRRTPVEMSSFYRQASVALCASEYEAASNSVMEGMAAGLALLATDVGNHREMRDSQMEQFGDSGILLVERSVDAFADALRSLTPARAREMGEINRREIQARWSWDVWAPRYAAFLRMALGKDTRMTSKPLSVPSPLPFDYWNTVNPDQFLLDDKANPARDWVGLEIAAAITAGCHTMVEVGPGPGFDYQKQFRPHVQAGVLRYEGYEGSSQLCARLAALYPEAMWQNHHMLELPPRAFDLLYIKAVLEHQPSLEPSLSHILGAAKRCVLLLWYRAPSTAAEHTIDAAGCHYQTFLRSDVMAVVEKAGWKIVDEQAFSNGNLGWRMERI